MALEGITPVGGGATIYTAYKIGDGVTVYADLPYASNISILQELGDSETAVMSQAGVTNALALAELSNSYELNKYVKEIVLATPIAEGVTINRVTMQFGSVTGARWYNALFIYTSAGDINVFTNTYATQQECYDNAYGVFGTGGNYCLIDYRELDKGHNTDILDITTFNHPLTIQFAPNIDNYLQDNSISTITNLDTWQGQMNKNTLTQNQTFNNVVKELYVSNPADFDISNLSHIICHKGSVTGSQFYNALFIYIQGLVVVLVYSVKTMLLRKNASRMQ